MLARPWWIGGVKIQPDPPVAGKSATITVSNGAATVRWRVAPDGPEHEVPLRDGRATIPVPATAAGKQISVAAGEDSNTVSDRFDVIDP